MKNYLILLLLAIILIVVSSCDRQWTGDIQGTITDVDSEEPVADVLVTASSMKNSYSISTVTDQDGKYVIHDARWGPNKVVAYHPEYGSSMKYADVIKDKSVTLDFKLTHRTEYVEPIITVWVTDQSDVPVENARVDLYEIPSDSFEDFVYLETAQTDIDGITTFQVARLYEDEIRFYQLRISALGFLNQTVDVTISWLDAFPTVHVKLEES